MSQGWFYSIIKKIKTKKKKDVDIYPMVSKMLESDRVQDCMLRMLIFSLSVQ